jgi:hypothetical protein
LEVKVVKYSTDSLDYPLVSENLQIEETGSDVIAFDRKNDVFHLLNGVAHSILLACNGSNTIKDIAFQISRKYSAPDLELVENDVKQTVDTYREKQLVNVIVEAGEDFRETSSTQVADSPLFAVALTGASMFPILLPTDKVLVKRSTIDELNVGDVVVWSDSSTLVAHRILSIDASSALPTIITKGDLSMAPDPPIESDRVLGKIVAVLRGGGIQWMRTLDSGLEKPFSSGANALKASVLSGHASERKPCFTRMQVLDLRDISVDAIRNIELVEHISLVLLSPQNAHAWPDVQARDVKSVVTVPENYRVYTGQPELLPEILEYLASPLQLVVCGQIFLTAFQADQVRAAFSNLVLKGQAYVSSAEAKVALETVTTIVSGEIHVVPHLHVRWMGSSILGPEFSAANDDKPLIAVGDLEVSRRLEIIPAGASRYNNIEFPVKQNAVAG